MGNMPLQEIPGLHHLPLSWCPRPARGATFSFLLLDFPVGGPLCLIKFPHLQPRAVRKLRSQKFPKVLLHLWIGIGAVRLVIQSRMALHEVGDFGDLFIGELVVLNVLLGRTVELPRRGHPSARSPWRGHPSARSPWSRSRTIFFAGHLGGWGGLHWRSLSSLVELVSDCMPDLISRLYLYPIWPNAGSTNNQS